MPPSLEASPQTGRMRDMPIGSSTGRNAEKVVAKCPRLDVGEMYVNRVCIIRSCPGWGTATERWGRNGAFSRTKVLEDEISASAEVNKISPR